MLKIPTGSPLVGDDNPQENVGVRESLEVDPLVKPHEIFWRICLESYEMSRLQTLMGWKLAYEDVETCIYEKGSSAIIAYRGTKATKDLYDDSLITFGNEYPRLAQASKFTTDLKELNPNFEILTTGHSLGGAIAREVGKLLSIASVTFNAAAPPSDPQVTNPIGTDYHIVMDIISAWQSPNVKRIDKGYRAKTSPYEQLIPYIWYTNVMSGIFPAHGLRNFSNETPGAFSTICNENTMLQNWFLSIPMMGRIYLLGILVGVGKLSFPKLDV